MRKLSLSSIRSESIISYALVYFLLVLAILASQLLLSKGLKETGIALTVDSLWYLSCAINLVQEGDFFMSIRNLVPGEERFAFALWPPGYPLAVAAPMLLGIPPVQASQLLSRLCLLLEILILFVLCCQRTRDRFLAVSVVWCFAVNYGTLTTHGLALSEPLFMVAWLLFILITGNALKRQNLRLFYLAVALASVATMIRYVGICLIVPLVYCAHKWFRQKGQRFLPLHSLAIISSIIAPLILWLIRNRVVSGYFTGKRVESQGFRFLTPLEQTFETAFRTYMPVHYQTAPFLVAVIVLLCGLVFLLIQSKRYNWYRFTGSEGLLSILGLSYYGFFYLTKIRFDIDPMQSRFLFPLFALALLGIAQRITAIPDASRLYYLKTAPLWGFVILGCLASLRSPVPPKTNYYLSQKQIESSELVEATASLTAPMIISNRADILNLGIARPVVTFPAKADWAVLERFLDSAASHRIAVVLFKEVLELEKTVSVEEFRKWMQMHGERVNEIVTTAEGAVYIVQ